MNKPARVLGSQELQIMKVVWERGRVTVRDVYEALRERRKIAYTTVMTMMNILDQKGFLKRIPGEDRAFVYEPARSQQAVMRAMAQAARDQVIAGPARRFRYVIAGTDDERGPYIYHYFSNKGGFGANKLEDGWMNLGGMQNPGGTPGASVERVEATYPFKIEAYGIAPESGGAGRRRGGCGGIFALRYLGHGPASLNIAGEGTLVAPYGMLGGRDGAPHAIWIERGNRRIDLTGRSNDVPIEPGDLIVHCSAGGGGYGDPRDRESELVRRDVANGFVSTDAARELYGLEDGE